VSDPGREATNPRGEA